jgi:hypothetical protein
VIHEKLYNMLAAGAGVEFLTNKGRKFSFKPKCSTWKLEELTTFKVEPGHEIISLKINKGILSGINQQKVPKGEDYLVNPKEAKWFTVSTLAAKEEGDEEDFCHENFSDKKEAMISFNLKKGTCKAKKGRSCVLIDSINNNILKKAGDKVSIEQCIEKTVEAGIFVRLNNSQKSIAQILLTLVKLFAKKEDIITFVFAFGLLMASEYMDILTKFISG